MPPVTTFLRFREFCVVHCWVDPGLIVPSFHGPLRSQLLSEGGKTNCHGLNCQQSRRYTSKWFMDPYLRCSQEPPLAWRENSHFPSIFCHCTAGNFHTFTSECGYDVAVCYRRFRIFFLDKRFDSVTNRFSWVRAACNDRVNRWTKKIFEWEGSAWRWNVFICVCSTHSAFVHMDVVRHIT